MITLPIDLGSGGAALTAVVYPDGYQVGDDVNLILYLQGFHDQEKGTFSPKMTIEEYFKTSFYKPVPEKLTASKKNVVLVAPTLGSVAEPGKLTSQGLDWYLDEVLKGMQQKGLHQSRPQPPTIKNLVLAAHSGGGKTMYALAESIRAAAATTKKHGGFFRECWGFDCLYGPPHDSANLNNQEKGKTPLHAQSVEVLWKEWAKGSGKTLWMHAATYEPKTRCKNLERLAGGWDYRTGTTSPTALTNVKVIYSQTTIHDEVVGEHWLDRLKSGPW
jgi:hypothetical protein